MRFARDQLSKITETACLSARGWEFEADKSWYGVNFRNPPLKLNE